MLPKETSEFIEQKLINVTDKVTVIVPVYNVSSFLSKCIESICEQEYPFLEIILVDDGSTDESGKICDSYAEKDARIKVIHKQNQGVSSARNTGLDVATGRWICFVDGDDYIMPEYVSYMLALGVAYDADIACRKSSLSRCAAWTLRTWKSKQKPFG